MRLVSPSSMARPDKKARRAPLSLSFQNLTAWDRQFVWHPFTQMKEWEQEPPLIIERGKGTYLWDVEGKKYLDGVSSLWVNIHGHRHPTLDQAIREQLGKIAHSTLLGASSPPSILLAKELVKIAPQGLSHVFFSDDGSTAVEVALKLAIQFWQQQGSSTKPKKHKTQFVRLDLSYHGDTAGSMSVGGVSLFQSRFKPLMFSSIKVEAPYCYRCPLHLTYPSCQLACVTPLKEILATRHQEIAGVVIEPMVQAVAGMIPSPPGFLTQVQELCSQYDVLLIADEVATGFGRTGKMFACEHERVAPDMMVLSKGITGGYLPLAVTLTSDRIYQAFLGEYEELKHFFHGHSYTGNALGCAAALANLRIFKQERTLVHLKKKVRCLARLLEPLAALPFVGDIRQMGLMVGVELVLDTKTRKPFPLHDRIGHKVAVECRKRGLLIRPIGNVLVLLPPLSSSEQELKRMTSILQKSLQEM